MAPVFFERARAAFAPPRTLALPFAGIDLSASGVKAVRLVRTPDGFVLERFSEVLLPAGAFSDGEIAERPTVVEAIKKAARTISADTANATLPESKSYLFETAVAGADKRQWRIAVEQKLGEFIPLPPSETAFDLVPVGKSGEETTVAGVGFARRIVEDTLGAFDEAEVGVRALEGETFAIARALLSPRDDATVLVVDIGKSTTKISVVAARIPRFTTTVGIGGHALTLAVEKHFGVTETEARRVKAERGIVPAPGNEDYLATMLSTVSAIRDEVLRRLDYWQNKVARDGAHRPVERAVLVGGNASVRGLPEYLESALSIPVTTGDVFTNFAPRNSWIPALEYGESLAYATAIGLALYDDRLSHA